ncbi:MAG TPA: hypothetical protein VMV49_11105 [Candidatus Deferrimicrobium sp.]|nr:hypothetical protein [Candidatus Deferrimicrobium sp.]
MDANLERGNSSAERTARIISFLSISPFQIVTYAAFAVVICNTFAEEMLLNTISGIFFLVIPGIPLIYVTQKRQIKNYSIEREDRFHLLLLQIIGFIGAAFIYFYYPKLTGLDTEILFIFTIGYTILLVLCFIINHSFKFKISLHMTGATSSITALVLVLGWPWSLLYLFCIPIAWARYTVRAHTIAQIIAGSAVGILVILVTYLGFWYF